MQEAGDALSAYRLAHRRAVSPHGDTYSFELHEPRPCSPTAQAPLLFPDSRQRLRLASLPGLSLTSPCHSGSPHSYSQTHAFLSYLNTPHSIIPAHLTPHTCFDHTRTCAESKAIQRITNYLLWVGTDIHARHLPFHYY